MFYCEKCRVEKGWPQGVLRSSGRCECCDEPAMCHDVPSRMLPRPKDPTRRVNAVFITADGLRAVVQVTFINGKYPKEVRRDYCPEWGGGMDRVYRYAGKSSYSEMHQYEEIT